MYDRPALTELLDAVRSHIENHIVPAVKSDAKLYYHTLVAANLLRIAEREVVLSGLHARTEWDRLNGLDGTDLPFPSNSDDAHEGLLRRNEALCRAIRSGHYDPPNYRPVLFAHLMATTREQLEVANPRYLQIIAQEDEAAAES